MPGFDCGTAVWGRSLCLLAAAAIALLAASHRAGGAEAEPASCGSGEHNGAGGASRPSVAVQVEEVITDYTNPRNGSNPLWNAGSPMLVRQGDRVFVSIPETAPDVAPNCNTRWQIWRRDDSGWELQQQAVDVREREPCPLAQFSDGRLFLSVNPSIDATSATEEFMGGTYPAKQFCSPHLLEFDAAEPARRPHAWMPRWSGPCTMKDHSYRGLGVDADRAELFVLNKTRDTMDYAWSFLDPTGRWANQGRIATEIGSCYPLLALRDRAAHVVTVGDIIEPVGDWLAYKQEHQEHRFFFVFRRIFYSWNSDIASDQFSDPIEIANVEDTAGYVWNLDLWLDAQGRAHLLVLCTNIASEMMRDRFFPDQLITTSLDYVVVDRGVPIHRSTLLKGGEGLSTPVPTWGRFHSTSDGRLYLVASLRRQGELENWLHRIGDDGRLSPGTRIPLRHPLSPFFTAAERGGCVPSNILDLYGSGEERESLRYARVSIGGLGAITGE